ncbi:MAG: 3-deoxy-7-phosphoheptulonate synthase [Bacteroidales bacterium]|nr:3-deoxy-7-phosphoheptulonate synthase [Bacteroidales bacterium]
MNLQFNRELFTPEALKEMYPVPPDAARCKEANDKAIREVLDGTSRKLLLVIGPCSADREDAVLDYISRLRPLQEEVSDKIVIVPRLYSNKPRTTGEGYKGMLHQPDPSARPDLFNGLVSSRLLHLHALERTGFSCADEMLYPENHIYMSDLLSYVAVGARSVENQQHRLVASGLDIPVGMKNPTGGDLVVMVNSIRAAQHGHSFIYRNWDVHSTGNPLAHAILRGYVDSRGVSHPNYHYEDLRRLADLYAGGGLVNPAVIVDCNHSNSGKRFEEQGPIALDVLHNARTNSTVGALVKGLMIESYLEDGCQGPGGQVYGQSITDPCLGWEKTRALVLKIAELWQ